MNDDNKYDSPRKQRHLERMSYAEKGRFFRIRNVLNGVFIFLAIVGMVVFFYKSRNIGGAILIVGIAIKVIECVLRIIR